MEGCISTTLLRGSCNPSKWIVMGIRKNIDKTFFQCDINFWAASFLLFFHLTRISLAKFQHPSLTAHAMGLIINQ